MQFGDKLRLLRQNKELTQPELAEQLGVEQSWLSKIENNKCLPSGELVQQTLEIFGLTLNELLQDLDSDYVYKQLSSIPEIKEALETGSRKQFHSRKRWIIASAVACVIGAVFIFSAFLNLFLPKDMPRYASNGVIYAGEPWDLYEEANELFHRLSLFDAPEELQEHFMRDGASMSGPLQTLFDKERGLFEQEILARRSFDEFVSVTDLGSYVVRPAFIGAGNIDIYGNVATEGSRIYEVHDHIDPNYLNGILWAIGYLLFIAGLFGFLVDYRLSKLKT